MLHCSMPLKELPILCMIYTLEQQMRTLIWKNMKDSYLGLDDFGSKYAIRAYFQELSYKIVEIINITIGVLRSH